MAPLPPPPSLPSVTPACIHAAAGEVSEPIITFGRLPPAVGLTRMWAIMMVSVTCDSQAQAEAGLGGAGLGGREGRVGCQSFQWMQLRPGRGPNRINACSSLHLRPLIVFRFPCSHLGPAVYPHGLGEALEEGSGAAQGHLWQREGGNIS